MFALRPLLVAGTLIVLAGLALLLLVLTSGEGSLDFRLAPDPHPAPPDARGCAKPEGGHAAASVPSPDLYCIELHSTPSAPAASGRVHLLPAGTPYGAAVTRDGIARHRFRLEARGLPEPSELGDFDRYVVWVAPPNLSPMIRVGEADNGTFDLGEAGFNQFFVMVSAEGPEPGEARGGPLVLRGVSASMQIRAHDLPYIIAEMATALPDSLDPAGGHEAHGPHGHADPPPATAPPPHAGAVRIHLGHHLGEHMIAEGAAAPWRMPPMHPLVQMPEQMMLLRPQVEPFLPTGGAEQAGDAGRTDDVVGPSGSASPIPSAEPRQEVFLASGDTLDLEAGPVMRRIGDLELPGYGFNRQVPGPLIRTEEGATVHVRFRNDTPLPSAVHWHGLRLDNRFDGVPGLTQDPIAPGASFDYELFMPDEGTFWYHPHLREDVMQDLGLAGNIHVQPLGSNDSGPLYAEVDREAFLVLDDHLVGPEGPVPYGREAPVHALMGRFGNLLLVNGSEDWSMTARPGEVVRFHLTNVANTRTFNVSFGDAPMKLVGGDVGKLPREHRVESVVIAPAERWVVEVRFAEPGEIAIENRVQALDHMAALFFTEVDTLGIVRLEGPPSSAPPRPFDELREAPALAAEVDGLVAEHLGRPPERSIALTLRHGELPFPLDPLLIWEGVFRPQVEWTGTMPDMDWLVSGRQAQWILRDLETGAENMEIDWRFRIGDRARIRIVNDRDGLHAMQHPIHLHGQRFLVLAVNGEPHPAPTWKDTVLVPVGAVVDLLVEMENPGSWMMHCHIAEHLESGMMAVFEVDR